MKRLVLGSILGSMAFGPIPVKAHAQDLPSANKDIPGSRNGLKDSVKDSKVNLPQLVQTVLDSGVDAGFANGYAQAVGLSEPMPSKKCHVVLRGNNNRDADDRDVDVVYTADTAGNGQNRPVCLYFRKGHAEKYASNNIFFRVSLDGQLEKAFTLQNKYDDDGKSLAEGRARIEEDIQDPEIQKAFKTEMSYWLKDWLKKQHNAKADTAKLTAPAVKEHAEAAHQAVNQEAADTHGASAPLPTTP